MDYRTERDPLGELKVPVEAYYGIQTARAVENIPISGLRAAADLVTATILVKKAAAEANASLGRLDPGIAQAIVAAADEILSGRLRDQFVVDVYQAGAGTSHNMNANEVLANRAAELLGETRGSYKRVHPNDHVNMGQSTNDVFPTATRLALLLGEGSLVREARDLVESLARKAGEFAGVLKTGRTHLQDAVPITLGQEFSGFSACIRRGADDVAQASEQLQELNIGATAVGTGLNAGEDYRERVVANLVRYTGLALKPAPNLFRVTQSMGDVLAYSGAMRRLAVELGKVASDLRLLSMGPRAGPAEITLPAVQPGSSIMPGKVNPSIPETSDSRARARTRIARPEDVGRHSLGSCHDARRDCRDRKGGKGRRDAKGTRGGRGWNGERTRKCGRHRKDRSSEGRRATRRRDGGKGEKAMRIGVAFIFALSVSVLPAPPALPAQSDQRRLFPPQDLGLLEGPDREYWQKPDLIMDALGIFDGAQVAELGAGGGWFTVRLSRRVGPNGVVYAQDIQPLMLEAIGRRVQRENLQNVKTVLGTATDPRLPAGLDAVLIVNAYYEINDPSRPEVIVSLLKNIARSLKPQGRIGVVDFTPGAGGPGPAPDERVNPEDVIRTASAAGLRLLSHETVPPFVYLLVFGKDTARGSNDVEKARPLQHRETRRAVEP
jgi:fumarate hydratase class II